MTNHMPPKPDLDSHSDEQLNRLYLAIIDALAEASTELVRTSRDPFVKGLVSVYNALASARCASWVDAGRLNDALELLVDLLAERDLEEVVSATFPTITDEDPRVTRFTALYLRNGDHESMLEAFNEAQQFVKELDEFSALSEGKQCFETYLESEG